MSIKPSSLTFTVKRHLPELVAPAKPTPNELKLLSDIDDQNDMRWHMPMVHFYRYQPLMAGKDPVQLIREALAKTLVFYYPFAGRLKEGPKGKLMVDCTGEGVMFIEADADVTLEQFGNDLLPPFPCFDELLYNVPGSEGLTGCPLLLIQVTRLRCGGFIFAFRWNHTMSDASGISQFLNALAEIACGAPKPSILPVWCRELLCARDPPRITCAHDKEYQQELPVRKTKSILKLHHRSFFFGPTEIATIRALLPHHLAAQSTSFEVLTACIWHCHTKALHWQTRDEEICFMGVVNARYGNCRFNPPLPIGFYGNASVCLPAITTVGKLCSEPLEYALKLVKEAKGKATEEYVHSVVDFMAIKGRPWLKKFGCFVVSDLSKAALNDVDFGWGKAVYAGPPNILVTEASFFVPFTNSKGERGRVVIICLPEDAMERFEKELNHMLKINN